MKIPGSGSKIREPRINNRLPTAHSRFCIYLTLLRGSQKKQNSQNLNYIYDRAGEWKLRETLPLEAPLNSEKRLFQPATNISLLTKKSDLAVTHTTVFLVATYYELSNKNKKQKRKVKVEFRMIEIRDRNLWISWDIFRNYYCILLRATRASIFRNNLRIFRRHIRGSRIFWDLTSRYSLSTYITMGLRRLFQLIAKTSGEIFTSAVKAPVSWPTVLHAIHLRECALGDCLQTRMAFLYIHICSDFFLYLMFTSLQTDYESSSRNSIAQ